MALSFPVVLQVVAGRMQNNLSVTSCQAIRFSFAAERGDGDTLHRVAAPPGFGAGRWPRSTRRRSTGLDVTAQ